MLLMMGLMQVSLLFIYLLLLFMFICFDSHTVETK